MEVYVRTIHLYEQTIQKIKNLSFSSYSGKSGRTTTTPMWMTYQELKYLPLSFSLARSLEKRPLWDFPSGWVTRTSTSPQVGFPRRYDPQHWAMTPGARDSAASLTCDCTSRNTTKLLHIDNCIWNFIF